LQRGVHLFPWKNRARSKREGRAWGVVEYGQRGEAKLTEKSRDSTKPGRSDWARKEPRINQRILKKVLQVFFGLGGSYNMRT